MTGPAVRLISRALGARPICPHLIPLDLPLGIAVEKSGRLNV